MIQVTEIIKKVQKNYTMEVEGLRAFQTASTIDPGIERKIKEQNKTRNH